EPLLAARGPYLHVELAGSGEAQIAGAHLDGPMPQAEPAADILGIVEQPVELLVGVIWMNELHHLYLVELMPALDATHVPPRAHLRAAEAGRIGDVTDRQPGAVEELVAIEVRDRDFRGGHEPKVVFGVAVEIVGELRQVTGADEALALDHRGRIDLDVAVLAD